MADILLTEHSNGLMWHVLEASMELAKCKMVPDVWHIPMAGCMYARSSVMECDMHLW